MSVIGRNLPLYHSRSVSLSLWFSAFSLWHIIWSYELKGLFILSKTKIKFVFYLFIYVHYSCLMDFLHSCEDKHLATLRSLNSCSLLVFFKHDNEFCYVQSPNLIDLWEPFGILEHNFCEWELMLRIGKWDVILRGIWGWKNIFSLGEMMFIILILYAKCVLLLYLEDDVPLVNWLI